MTGKAEWYVWMTSDDARGRMDGQKGQVNRELLYHGKLSGVALGIYQKLVDAKKRFGLTYGCDLERDAEEYRTVPPGPWVEWKGKGA